MRGNFSLFFMETLSELKKLDDVLRYFEIHFKDNPLTENDVKNAIENPFDFDLNEIRPIIHKLVNDKRLKNVLIDGLNTYSPNREFEYVEDYYSITFDGRFFIQAGGYVRRAELNLSENIRMEKLEIATTANQLLTTRLTILIAVGTLLAAIYYGIEIYKELHLFFHRHGLYWIWEIIPKKSK